MITFNQDHPDFTAGDADARWWANIVGLVVATKVERHGQRIYVLWNRDTWMTPSLRLTTVRLRGFDKFLRVFP